MPIQRYTPSQEFPVSQNAILFYAPYNIYFENFKLRRSITRYSVDRITQQALPDCVKPSKTYTEKDIVSLVQALVRSTGRDPGPAVLDLLYYNHYHYGGGGEDGYEIYLTYRKLLMIAQGQNIAALQQEQVDIVQQLIDAAGLHASADFNFVGESRKCSHYIEVKYLREDGHRDYSKPAFVLKPDTASGLYSLTPKSYSGTVVQALAVSAAIVEIKQALAPILI